MDLLTQPQITAELSTVPAWSRAGEQITTVTERADFRDALLYLGAVAYLALEHFLAQLYPTAWQLGLGLLLVFIALFARNGLLGLGEVLWQRYGARRAAS